MTTRRRFLRTTAGAAAASAAGLAGCTRIVSGPNDPVPIEGSVDATATTQFRGGPRRRGDRTDLAVPDSATVDWALDAVNTGDHTAAKASPLSLPDGDVLIPGDDGTLRRVAPDGAVRWTAETEPAARGIHGTPAVANGVAYVGAYDGALYAFDLDTGRRYWRRRLADAIGSSPAYHDGRVFVAVEYYDPSGALYAVDAVTGEVLWDDQRPTDHPHSTPAIDRETGRIVVGANDGRLYAWTYPDLEFAWSFETGAAIKGPVAVTDRRAVVGSWDRRVYAVELTDGTEAWRFGTDDMVMSGPAVADGTVYVGSHDSRLYALAAATGEREWAFDTGGRIIGCPTATAGSVLVGSQDRRLYAVDRAGGEERWSVGAAGQVTATPLPTGDAVYVACRASAPYLRDDDGPTGKLYRIT